MKSSDKHSNKRRRLSRSTSSSTSRSTSGNQIVEILMHRDGMGRREAEAELRRVRAEFDPTSDDPEEVLAYEFGLEPDYILDLLWD